MIAHLYISCGGDSIYVYARAYIMTYLNYSHSPPLCFLAFFLWATINTNQFIQLYMMIPMVPSQ